MSPELSLSNANALANLLNSGSSLSYGSEHLNKVKGIEGFNTFPTKPSSEYAVFEADSDIMCIKVTDEKNTSFDRYFAFKEISKEEAMKEISPYLMKGELDSFKDSMLTAIKSELSSFKEEILNAKQPIQSVDATAKRTIDVHRNTADTTK